MQKKTKPTPSPRVFLCPQTRGGAAVTSAPGVPAGGKDNAVVCHSSATRRTREKPKKKEHIELVILGSGYEEQKLKNYIKLNSLKKYVKLIGYKKNPFKYIKHSNALILSSEFEGSPNILLEAACLKKLIISSDCKTGPKKILSYGKGGYLYQVNNYKQLSKIIAQLKLNSSIVKKKNINLISNS